MVVDPEGRDIGSKTFLQVEAQVEGGRIYIDWCTSESESSNVYRRNGQIVGIQFVSTSTFNKLMSVFHASVLLLIINFVITLSK